MIILDTDHLSVLQRRDASGHRRLVAAMEHSDDPHFATSVISLEEQTRGWLAAISRAKGNVSDEVKYYTGLVGLIEFYSRWDIVAFDADAADRFASSKALRIRLGTMDLKIAAVTLALGGLLLSANLRDFQQVPGLRVENWLG